MEASRRDFLEYAVGAFGVMAAGGVLYPVFPGFAKKFWDPYT
ncbi:MAG: ubiquinol-cytochrome c reductase iron-sulfur subunit N-terminal domain-containing protein [Hydrogenobaculum sp.]